MRKVNRIESSFRLRFTPNELEFIKTNYIIYSDRYIARCLKRTEVSIRHKRSQLNLSRKNGRKVYSPLLATEVQLQAEIESLDNFINKTKSSVWREIALTRKLSMVKLLISMRSKAKDLYETSQQNVYIKDR